MIPESYLLVARDAPMRRGLRLAVCAVPLEPKLMSRATPR